MWFWEPWHKYEWIFRMRAFALIECEWTIRSCKFNAAICTDPHPMNSAFPHSKYQIHHSHSIWTILVYTLEKSFYRLLLECPRNGDAVEEQRMCSVFFWTRAHCKLFFINCTVRTYQTGLHRLFPRDMHLIIVSDCETNLNEVWNLEYLNREISVVFDVCSGSTYRLSCVTILEGDV